MALPCYVKEGRVSPKLDCLGGINSSTELPWVEMPGTPKSFLQDVECELELELEKETRAVAKTDKISTTCTH